MNLNQLSKDQFTARCPECYKLYSVRSAEITEAEPRFQCANCQTLFSVRFAEALELGAVIGTVIEKTEEVKTPQERQEVFSCPKCLAGYAPGETECRKCGLIFVKFEESQKRKQATTNTSYSAGPEVRELWDIALNNYENFDAHQNFISAAWADRSLDYASQVYAGILSVVPQDEIAKKAQKQIEALMMTRFETVSQAVEGKNRNWLEDFSFFKDVVLVFRKIKLMSVIMVLCGALITMGLLLPHMRNLVGVGTSLLFFVLALRYYFRVI